MKRLKSILLIKSPPRRGRLVPIFSVRNVEEIETIANNVADRRVGESENSTQYLIQQLAERVNNRIEQQSENTQLLIEQLRQQNQTISQIGATRFEQQQQQINTLNNSTGQWYTSLSTLWNTVDNNQNAQLNNQIQQNQQQQSLWGNVYTAFQQVDGQISRTTDHLWNLDNQIANNDNKVGELNNHVTEFESTLNSQIQLDNQQNTRLDRFETTLAESEYEDRSREQKIANLENLANTIRDSIINLERSDANTNNRVENLNNTVSNISVNSNSLNPEAVSNLERTITSNVIQTITPELSNVATPEQVRQEIERNNGLLTPALLAGITSILTPQLTDIRNRVAPSAIASAAAAGTCQTMQPGNCGASAMTNAIGNGIAPILNNLERGANAAGAAASIASIPLLNQINSKLGTQISAGGIAGTLGRLYNKLAIDRWLNLLNTALLIHNALMLSNNILETATGICDTALDIAGFKFADAEGNDIDFSTVVSSNFQSLVRSIVGAEQYTQLTTTFAKANRIYQASSNILSNVRSIIDSANNLAETTGVNVSTIGNALKEHGVIPDNAYNDMPEKLGKWNRVINRLEGLDNAMDALSNITSEVKSVQDDWEEITKNKKELQTAINAVSKEQKDKKEVEEKKLYLLVPETTEEDEKESK